MPLGRRAQSAPLDLSAPSALRDRKVIRETKATVDCKALKATALSVPRARLALVVWLEPLVLLAPKGRKVIAEVTAQSAPQDQWGHEDSKGFAATQGHRASRALADCKDRLASKDLLGHRELWACEVIPARKDRRVKFPKARSWRFPSP